MSDPFTRCRNSKVQIRSEPEIPTKKITNANFESFKNSEGYNRIFDFIVTVNQSVKESPESIHETSLPADIGGILNLLDQIEQMALSVEPRFESSRFGSLSFRDLISGIESQISPLHDQVIPDSLFNQEISTYLANAFGDKTRMDYGSGHELNFICWLLCLYLIGYFENSYQYFIVLFDRYIKLMRLIQMRFRLEPAGSHGVWV